MASGLLDWSNAIRFTMENDPGRQLFHDQVNTHGFLFLNDYLANILSGAKQDPLIELVKTPGRKKLVTKKSKVASKLNLVASLDATNEKENLSPINNFHRTLLEAKDPPPHTHATVPLQVKLDSSLREIQRNHDDNLLFPFRTITVPTYSNPQPAELFAPSHPEQNDLSVIVEDDENPERTCVSIQPMIRDNSRCEGLLSLGDNKEQRLSELQNVPTEESTKVAQSSGFSSDELHSIASDPQPLHSSPIVTRAPEGGESKIITQHSVEDYTIPLENLLRNSPTIHGEATVLPIPLYVVPLDSKPGQDVDVPTPNPDTLLTSPKVAEDRFGPVLYPALPAPIPLRKSIRAPHDPSMGTGPLGAATPGAVLGNKRTSWLKKAREAKALENTGRNNSIPIPSMPFTTGSLKRKSTDITVDLTTSTGLEDEERRHKSAKNVSGDVAPLKSIALDSTGDDTKTQLHQQSSPFFSHSEHMNNEPEGMLDRLKRTVEDLGARVGKTLGKPLGADAAVTALAEARAAAEARVAERNTKEEGIARTATSAISLKEIASVSVAQNDGPQSPRVQRRLSISDLPQLKGSVMGAEHKNQERTILSAHQLAPDTLNKVSRVSTTTTPPDSPPATRPSSSTLHSGPVFNRPPPVFIPPSPPAHIVKSTIASSMPSKTALSVNSLSKQSTLESMESIALFDNPGNPAWMPSTQDTDYSSTYDTQIHSQHVNMFDEDDSWPTEPKLTASTQWAFGASIGKEDSMTWSTSSRREDSAVPYHDHTGSQNVIHQVDGLTSNTFGVGPDNDCMGHEGGDGLDDNEINDVVMDGKISVGPVKVTRSDSQMSMASLQSSQSQSGFFSQASKLLSNALGTSKKGKPEVKKVLQLAAVAAKKQQEENDKKAVRLKEMENRRQLAIQRKAEEEKSREQERDRKLKEESERRKREREENTDKRPLKMPASKKDEENIKKRKVVAAETEKMELKRPASKTTLKSLAKQPTALSSSAAYNVSLQTAASSGSKLTEIKPSKPLLTTLGKGKATPKQLPIPEDDLSQPSQLVQVQMAARAKAQLQAAHLAFEVVQSESIELPEINSEYSDSEDEDRPKTFDPPNWAQSPELRQALHLQSTINPDDIFGTIKPLRMEELFKTRSSRFRARTSSANWTGTDRLTLEEEKEYAKRMGYR